MVISSDKDQKEKKSPYMEMSRDNSQKRCLKGNKIQFQEHPLIFVRENISLLPATSILSCQPKA